MNVEMYAALRNPDDNPDTLESDYDRAKKTAMEISGVVIAYIFEFSDSEIIDDYRD
jgi:hypothetical protein